nr:hypothetical protein [Tanacetum cinerariifolium]
MFSQDFNEVSSLSEDLSDIGSLGLAVYGYDRLPMHLPSPDYVSGPEYPPSPVYVPYVPDPAYPEFMPLEDEVLQVEEQPLPAAVSPTTNSPGYINESDSEEDPEKEDDEDPADYPTNIDDDDDEEESFGDDADDEEEDEGGEEDKDEEEEHLAPVDSILPPIYRTTIPSSPLPTSPTDAGVPLGNRDAMIRLRAESPSTSHPLPLPLPPPIVLPHTRASMVMMRAIATSTYILVPRSETPLLGTPLLLPIPLPTSSPPLLLPSTDRREDVPEVTLPPQKRGFRADYGFVGTLDAKIRRDRDREIGYEITDVWEDPDEISEELPATHVAELSQRMTDNVTTVRQYTDEIYGRLDDAHDDRLLMSGQLNSLRRGKRSHAHTGRLKKSEARASREAWVQSMDASDTAHSETQMVALQSQQRPARDPAHPDVPEKADNSIADALAAGDADRSKNSKDNHDSRTGVRRQAPLARECTYPDFMKCKPIYFKGTEGFVKLTQWFKRMETVFRISNYTVENQIKLSTCILLGSALTWWNSHVKTVGHDELALMCARMFHEDLDNIERYVGGLPDMIYGSVMTSKPKTMQDAVEFATELMDKKICTFVERQTKNKRKAYIDGPGEKKPYGGSKPLCSKCNYHHDGPGAPKFHKCNRVGHLACNCRSPTNANTANNQRGTEAGQKATCFECGAQGNFKREFPKLKNNNRGNPVRNGNALAKVYAVGYVGTNPDSNVVTGTFLLNNHYASILFDTGADRIFMSTKYGGGLVDMIHGSVMASMPKTMQCAIEFATELMDKEISTLAERQAKKKRKLNNNNQAQQQPPKKNQGHYKSDCLELKNQKHGNQAG